MSKILSIIIPTYNMSAYLRPCLASLLCKGHELLDVLIVNDGSTDDSAGIAAEFVAQYPETFTLINKPNGHYGSCINAALPVVKGKYVRILDADDSYYTEALAALLETLAQINADVVFTDYEQVFTDGTPSVVMASRMRPDTLLPTDELLASSAHKKANRLIRHIGMHALTYRTDLLRSIHYRQSEGMVFTDTEWAFEPLAYARTAYYLPQTVYRYLLGREGQSVDPAIRHKTINAHGTLACSLLDRYERMPARSPMVEKVLQQILYREFLFVYRHYIVLSPESDDTFLRQVDARLRTHDGPLRRRLERKVLSSPLIPIPFVALWQKNPESRLLKWGVNFYRKRKKITNPS